MSQETQRSLELILDILEQRAARPKSRKPHTGGGGKGLAQKLVGAQPAMVNFSGRNSSGIRMMPPPSLVQGVQVRLHQHGHVQSSQETCKVGLIIPNIQMKGQRIRNQAPSPCFSEANSGKQALTDVNLGPIQPSAIQNLLLSSLPCEFRQSNLAWVRSDLLFITGIFAAKTFCGFRMSQHLVRRRLLALSPTLLSFWKPISAVFLLAKFLTLQDFKDFWSKGILSTYTL